MGIKEDIAALKKKWNDSNAKAHQAPGSIALYVPVDSDSRITYNCPGKLIKFLDFSDDAIGPNFGNIFTQGEESSNSNVRLTTETPFAVTEKNIYRPVKIKLNTPIAFPTSKNTNRLMSFITARFPSLMTIDAINYFLYNMSSQAKRPTSFKMVGGRREYFVSNIDKAKLGSLTIKAGKDTPTPPRT